MDLVLVGIQVDLLINNAGMATRNMGLRCLSIYFIYRNYSINLFDLF